MKKRLVGGMVALLMTVGLAQAVASAAPDSGDFTVSTQSGYTFDDGQGILHITDDGAYTISMKSSGTTTNQGILVDVGVQATITLDNLSIDRGAAADQAAWAVAENSTGDVSLVLRGRNVLIGGSNCAGLQKGCTHGEENCGCGTLTIRCEQAGSGHDCQASTCGALTATGGVAGAGIGGGVNQNGVRISILGGMITANAGRDAAGIGGGRGSNAYGDGRYLKVAGGVVKAFGNAGGAGIGGGRGGNGTWITLSGGSVEASAEGSGAGIGGGSFANDRNCGGEGREILLDGAEVISGSGTGAGIGGGWGGCGRDITINAAIVNAGSSNGGAGIGGGGWRGVLGGNDGERIQINGGYVLADGIVGIGASGCARDIVIAGGTIYANGMFSGIGIGNFPPLFGGSTSGVVIRGGNLSAHNDRTPQATPIATQPINGLGEDVFCQTIMLPNAQEGHSPGVQWWEPVADIQIEGADYFETKDVVINQDGELRLWLPEGCKVKSVVMQDGTVYYPVTISAVGNGEVAANLAFGAQGNQVTLAVSAEPPDELLPGSLRMNGQPVAVAQGGYGFTMPDQEAVVEAAFGRRQPLTVVHGLGQGDYYPGERVQLTADTPQAGFAFDQWVCTAGDGTLEETQSPNAVFVMGSQAATVEARYKQTAAATPTPEPSSTPEGAPTPGASPLPSPTPTPSGEAAGGNPQTGDTTPTHAVWASILLALALGAIGMSGRGRRRGIQ